LSDEDEDKKTAIDNVYNAVCKHIEDFKWEDVDEEVKKFFIDKYGLELLAVEESSSDITYSYEVTIPTELIIGDDGTGTLDITATLNNFSTEDCLNINISSDYSFQLKTDNSASLGVSYRLYESDNELSKNNSDNAYVYIFNILNNENNVTNITKTLTAKLNETPVQAGNYSDKLTFTISKSQQTNS
jgi:hypothetical protein